MAASDDRLFYEAFDGSPVGIALETLEGQPVFVNPALRSMLGFSEEEMRGKHCVDFSPPEDAQKDWALFQQLRQGSIKQYQLEKRFFRRDGSLIWGRLSISLLNRPSPMVIAVVEDITEEKRKQDDLETVTEGIASAVNRCSRDFRYLWANQRYANWIKRSRNEIIGRLISDVLGKDAFDALLPHFEQVLSGKAVNYEQEVKVNGLGQRWLSAAYTPTLDANGVANGWVAVVADITEQKRAEMALSRLAAIVESSEDAIVSKDLDGIITSWNAGAERIFGYQEAEVIGNPITILIPPELQEEENKILETLRSGGRHEHLETVRVTKAGKKLDVSLSIFPIKDSTGKITGISKIIHDISERRKVERVLTDMTRRLIAAQEQERTRIGRELHDDIGQRLAMLAIEIEGLKEHPSEVTTRAQELRKLLGDISDDIQALSHDLHSSKLEYLGVVTGMGSWCNEFAKRHKTEITFKAEVSSVLPSDVGICLFRVLQESLHNAARHSGVGRVEVELQEQSGEIHLIVSDSGRGFNVQEAMKGQGLGLTSMSERVQIVNGSIEIDSKPTGGTRIHVRVPFNEGIDLKRAAG